MSGHFAEGLTIVSILNATRVLVLTLQSQTLYPLRSGPRIVDKNTSVSACFERLGGQCSCLKKQNSRAKHRSTALDRLSEAIPCDDLAYLCLREQESFLTSHIAPDSRTIDASPSLTLSGTVKCLRVTLFFSFYEWRCIYPGEQMMLAPFMEKYPP